LYDTQNLIDGGGPELVLCFVSREAKTALRVCSELSAAAETRRFPVGLGLRLIDLSGARIFLYKILLGMGESRETGVPVAGAAAERRQARQFEDIDRSC